MYETVFRIWLLTILYSAIFISSLQILCIVYSYVLKGWDKYKERKAKNDVLKTRTISEIKYEINNINITLDFLNERALVDKFLQYVSKQNHTKIKTRKDLIRFSIKRNNYKNKFWRGQYFYPICDLINFKLTWEGEKFWNDVNFYFQEYYKSVMGKELRENYWFAK